MAVSLSSLLYRTQTLTSHNRIMLLGWPADQLGRNDTASNRYYHYRQTTREVTRPQVAPAYQ